jgi:hypothetical protein
MRLPATAIAAVWACAMVGALVGAPAAVADGGFYCGASAGYVPCHTNC